MSYILDALKKLEKEKSRKNRPGGMVNISGELFAGDSGPRAGEPRRFALPGLLLVVALLVGGGIYWYFNHSVPNKTARIENRPPALLPVPVQPPVPVVTPSPATPVVPPAAIPAQNPAPSPAVAPQAAGERKGGRKASPVRTSVVRTPLSGGQSQPLITPPAEIKVQGIAWQEERSARRAVVNGFLMQEGGMVAGAKINEILADRVRFASPSGMFEVPMISSGLVPAVR